MRLSPPAKSLPFDAGRDPTNEHPFDRPYDTKPLRASRIGQVEPEPRREEHPARRPAGAKPPRRPRCHGVVRAPGSRAGYAAITPDHGVSAAHGDGVRARQPSPRSKAARHSTHCRHSRPHRTKRTLAVEAEQQASQDALVVRDLLGRSDVTRNELLEVPRSRMPCCIAISSQSRPIPVASDK